MLISTHTHPKGTIIRFPFASGALLGLCTFSVSTSLTLYNFNLIKVLDTHQFIQFVLERINLITEAESTQFIICDCFIHFFFEWIRRNLRWFAEIRSDSQKLSRIQIEIFFRLKGATLRIFQRIRICVMPLVCVHFVMCCSI